MNYIFVYLLALAVTVARLDRDDSNGNGGSWLLLKYRVPSLSAANAPKCLMRVVCARTIDGKTNFRSNTRWMDVDSAEASKQK
jgi:hypothetical protein